jgi:hypothetical protein
MPWLTIATWTVGAALLLALLYALHRLGLWLETRGHIYYWHKKSTISASRMWTPLQEAVEPQIKHVVEAEELHLVDEDDREGDPERPAAWKPR